MTKLPLKIHLPHGGQDLHKRDRERAARFLAGLSLHGPIKAHRKAQAPVYAPGGGGGSIDVTNSSVAYIASVGVGKPPTQYDLLVDTGSSNTWVGADKPYKRTDTSTKTGNSFSVKYGSGEAAGEEYNDELTFRKDLAVMNQSIGVATSTEGLTGIDGILGMGPVDLTIGTVSGTEDVPTVMDNLRKQGSISQESLGVFFKPWSTDDKSGELNVGGPDPENYTGHVNYVTITDTSPASGYWGINASVIYDGATILPITAGIVDTGTTLVLFATEAFKAYQQATGGILDKATGLLKITEEQYHALQSLFFNVGGHKYELTPNAQILPRALTPGNPGTYYLIVGDLQSQRGSGLDFIFGFAFLQRFYSVYDTTNQRVGLAKTKFTYATTN